MCRTGTAIALLALAVLTGCGDHIQDPWARGNPNFEEEAFHPKALNEELRHRIPNQSDR